MRPLLLTALALLSCAAGAACTRGSEPTVTPDPAVKPTSAESAVTAPTPAPTVAPEAGPVLVTSLEGHVGETVRMDVTKAKSISQHMMSMVPGKDSFYFTPIGSTVDFVGYVTATPTCSATMRLTGKVIQVSGPGKGPSPGVDHAERQLDVTAVECR